MARRDQSLADDLDVGPGRVSTRVALLLRGAERKPVCPLDLIKTPPINFVGTVKCPALEGSLYHYLEESCWLRRRLKTGSPLIIQGLERTRSDPRGFPGPGRPRSLPRRPKDMVKIAPNLIRGRMASLWGTWSKSLPI